MEFHERNNRSSLPGRCLLLFWLMVIIAGANMAPASSTYLGETGLVEVPLADTLKEGEGSVSVWVRFSSIDGDDDMRPAALMFESGLPHRFELGAAFLSSGGTDPFLFDGIDNLRFNIKFRFLDELGSLPSMAVLSTVEDILGMPVYGSRLIVQKRVDHTTLTAGGGYLMGEAEERAVAGAGVEYELKHDIDLVLEGSSYFPSKNDPQEDPLYLVTPAVKYHVTPRITLIFSVSYGSVGDIQYARAMMGLNLTSYDPKTIDRDGDGIIDRLDKCMAEMEDFDDWEDEDGCPDLDNDGDTIPDELDETPNGEELAPIEYRTPTPKFRIKIKPLKVPGSLNGNGQVRSEPQGKPPIEKAPPR